MIQIDIELPNSCSECRFETEAGYCKAMESGFCGSTTEEGRPEWCPLKEQPEIIRCKDCKHGEQIAPDYISCQISVETKNAKITSVSITMADHGCLTFYIVLEGDGWGCGFGGYCIGHGSTGWKENEFTAESGMGLVAMMRIMDTVGVDKWEDLKGMHVRCKIDGWGSGIDEIGHITKEKWFNIRNFFKQRQR